jgi:hypothetical protein
VKGVAAGMGPRGWQEGGVKEENETAQGLPPGPDPALKRLEMFVGKSEMKGHTLDSDAGQRLR